MWSRLFQHARASLLVLSSAIALFSVSCEDVINVDLNTVEPRIVIEGKVNYSEYLTGTEPFSVKISRTGDFYDPSSFPTVSDAIVTISDTTGSSITLLETEPGLYLADYSVPLAIYPRLGRTYTLDVEIDGRTYTASSTIRYMTWIDQLYYNYVEAGAFDEEGYKVFCSFTDREGYDDFVRMTIEQNGEMVEDYFLHDGRWSDGNRVEFDAYGFEAGDTLDIKLISMDKVMYEYFEMLASVVATDDNHEPNWIPDNPITNLSNGALGYFGAFSVTRRWLFIPEK